VQSPFNPAVLVVIRFSLALMAAPQLHLPRDVYLTLDGLIRVVYWQEHATAPLLGNAMDEHNA